MAPAAFRVRRGNTRLRALLSLVLIGATSGLAVHVAISNGSKSYPQLRHPCLLRRGSGQSRTRWPTASQLEHLISVRSASVRSCLQFFAIWPISIAPLAMLGSKWVRRTGDTITIAAFDDISVAGDSCICQPLKVVLGAIRPSVVENISRGVRAAIECHSVFLIQVALKINQSVHISNFLVLCLRLNVSGFITKATINVLVVDLPLQSCRGESCLLAFSFQSRHR